MRGYSTQDVAKTLGLSVGQVYSYVRAGFLAPERGSRGEYRFSFQDLVLLRTANGLVSARIGPRQVRRALRKLKAQLPSGRPLTGMHVVAEGQRIVVSDGRTRWHPDSGQSLFNFDVDEIAEKIAPLVRKAVDEARVTESGVSADEWYDLGCDLETCAPAEARDAYRRAVELAPHHAEAHVNLGRLLHAKGELDAARAHYELALAAEPDNATAAFNLGILLEDEKRDAEAIAAYERAIRSDPQYADAHYNLAGLYERAGKKIAALRHLKTYKQLTRD